MSLSPIKRIGRPQPLSVTAADWVLRQDKGSLTTSEQHDLEAWLNANSAHADAYDDATWALDATARNAGEPELMALRDAALAARGDRRSRALLAGGLGGALAASILGVWLWTGSPRMISSSPQEHVQRSIADPNHEDYATAIGQRLVVTLPDSSVVTLDTGSKIRVAYNAFERGVQLLRGQALFEVAHGKATPFQVYAAGQRITAVGTLFNVRLDGQKVRVALLQGAIRVNTWPSSDAPEQDSAHEFVMRAGEVAELQPAENAAVTAADVNQETSWRGGELIFNDTPLTDAVSEINRYTNKPIVIADSAVGNKRITGVFKTNDPERFSQAMSEILPVEVEHAPDGRPVLRSRK